MNAFDHYFNTFINRKLSWNTYYNACVDLMDDDLREKLHSKDIDNEHDFLKAYCREHKRKFKVDFRPFNIG